MLQRSMIHDFPLNMFINLQYTNLNNEPNTHTTHKIKKVKHRNINTFWPLSINLTAKSSLVKTSLTNFATAKFPDPISLTTS